MLYCMLHTLSPLNHHWWNRVAVFSVMHMYVALSDGLIYMPLNNLYVCNTYNIFTDMSHSYVCMSTYSCLASLAPHLLILLYTSRMLALAVPLWRDQMAVPCLLSWTAWLPVSLLWRAPWCDRPWCQCAALDCTCQSPWLGICMRYCLVQLPLLQSACIPSCPSCAADIHSPVHTRTHCKTRSLCC